MPGQRQYIRDDIPQVQGCSLNRRLSRQLPNPRDDITGAVGILNDLRQRLTDFLKVRVAIRQQADAGIGIVDNGGERLVDFMGNRRGHFAHGRQTTDVSQRGVASSECLFRPLAVINVRVRSIPF